MPVRDHYSGRNFWISCMNMPSNEHFPGRIFGKIPKSLNFQMHLFWGNPLLFTIHLAEIYMTCPSEIANLFAHQSCSLLDASSAARYLVHPEAQEFQIFLASRDSPGEVKTRHSLRNTDRSRRSSQKKSGINSPVGGWLFIL